jgi:hypothetical protein
MIAARFFHEFCHSFGQEWREQRLQVEKRASGLGRAAPRFQEIDLWPLIVQNSWDPADAAFESRVLSYANNKGGSAMLAFCMKHMDELKSIGVKRLGSWKMRKKT